MATKAEMYAREFMQALANEWASENIEDFEGPVELTDFLVETFVPILSQQVREDENGAVEPNDPVFTLVGTILTFAATPASGRGDGALDGPGAYSDAQIQQAQAAAEAAIEDAVEVTKELTWNDDFILGEESDEEFYGYYVDVDDERGDNNAAVNFKLSAVEQPADQQNAVNLQITDFAARDVLDVTGITDVTGEPTITAATYDEEDDLLGISLITETGQFDQLPSWDIQFSNIDEDTFAALNLTGTTSEELVGELNDAEWLVLA